MGVFVDISRISYLDLFYAPNLSYKHSGFDAAIFFPHLVSHFKQYDLMWDTCMYQTLLKCVGCSIHLKVMLNSRRDIFILPFPSPSLYWNETCSKNF